MGAFVEFPPSAAGIPSAAASFVANKASGGIQAGNRGAETAHLGIMISGGGPRSFRQIPYPAAVVHGRPCAVRSFGLWPIRGTKTGWSTIPPSFKLYVVTNRTFTR